MNDNGEQHYEGPRYHTEEEIAGIYQMIGDLNEETIREIIDPDKMKNIYGFNPNMTEEIVQKALDIIAIFKNADELGHSIITEMG